jgi:calcineurin-like phosphoesterase family protein
MNETIIHNHNSRVAKEDSVFFLGDFCFKNSPGGKEGEGNIFKASYYLNQLNGNFIFIKGNHDRNNSLKTPIERMNISFGGNRMCLVHNPIHADPKFAINLVGHVHEKWKVRNLTDTSIMLNVGVDVHRFMPISYDEINKEITLWKKRQVK